MVQTHLGAEKSSAKLNGLTLEEYRKLKNMNLKKCFKCKVWLDKSKFNVDRSRHDELFAKCKSCRYTRIRFPVDMKTRDIMRKKGFIFCIKCNDWISDRASDGRCRIHKNLKYVDYYKGRNGRQIRHRVHCRKRNMQEIPSILQDLLLAFFKGNCAYCETRQSTTWDHVKPVAKGGGFVLGNIVPACISCNSSKKAEELLVWSGKQNTVLSDRLNVFLQLCGDILWVC